MLCVLRSVGPAKMATIIDITLRTKVCEANLAKIIDGDLYTTLKKRTICQALILHRHIRSVGCAALFMCILLGWVFFPRRCSYALNTAMLPSL